jgi:arylsulfatase A-like enzyme
MLVLLYILDSLRPDFLGCYGDRGATTPHLDRFAARATRFTRAYSPAPWSKASGAAMLTGFLPRSVRVRALLDRLPADVPVLAEQVATSGFRTIAASANPFISSDFGLLRGFEHVIEGFRPGRLPGETFQFHANHFLRVADSLTVDPKALILARSPALHRAILDVLSGDEPSFVLCWSMDTHAPFFVRGERSLFGNPLDRLVPAADPEWLTSGLTTRDIISLYRDMIAFNDHHFGELVSALQARGLWDDALVIVAGDHGEAFGEHEVMGHISGLWEEQVRVPLLVKLPNQQQESVATYLVSLVDITPTVAAVAEGEWPQEGWEGWPLLEESQQQEERTLLLENPEGWALRQGEWKALARADGERPLLFNLETDPAERYPLADDALRQELESRALDLRARADRRAAQWSDAGAPVDDAVLARLRALGYL